MRTCGLPEIKSVGLKFSRNSFETHLGGELLARSLASSRFASRLLGASHHRNEVERRRMKRKADEIRRHSENEMKNGGNRLPLYRLEMGEACFTDHLLFSDPAHSKTV